MVKSSPAKPDLAAYETVTRLKPEELVDELRRRLGVRLVALIAGVKETRAVHEWAAGSRDIRNGDALERLRLAYRALYLITTRDSDQVAQAWFQGLNPKLGDRSPARLLRDGVVDEVGPDVLAAARAFAAVG
ncbi:MAG: hypothetical protein ACRDZ3_12400 [Acidimicrobiia bacterium]